MENTIVDRLSNELQSVFGNASEDDAVLILDQHLGTVSELPYCFPEPTFDGVKASYHTKDFALFNALIFTGVGDWPTVHDLVNPDL